MNKDLIRYTEGLLFLSGSKGITIGELISLLKKDQLYIEEILINLTDKYENDNSAFTILKSANTYKLVTLANDNEIYQEYAQLEYNDKISKSCMETLAIIAYNQPITKDEIELTKGVVVGHNLRTLAEKDLIKVIDKTKPNNANIYATTSDFLDYLGINSLEELPTLKDFIYEIKNQEDHQLFDETSDFKEIRKRLLSTQNIISSEDEILLEIDDEIEIPELNLEMENDDKITEDDSRQ